MGRALQDPAVDVGGLGAAEGSRRGCVCVPTDLFPLCSLQTSWTPGWMLEDAALGPGAAAAAQMCDICQATFPADTTAQADYLKHVLTHMK